jgi:SAM-dependent methyltransferase
MHCPYCLSQKVNDRYQVDESMFRTGETFELAECGECQSLYQAAPPQDMSRYYGEGYYSLRLDAGSGALKTWAKGVVSRQVLGYRSLAGAVLSKLLPTPVAANWLGFAGARLDESILDVGCGNGFYLEVLRDFGFTKLTGVDPFMEVSKTLPGGIRLIKGEVSDITETFDLIIVNHAFEHMPQPEQALRQMKDRLNPAGRILVRIPVAGCLAWSMYGVNWVQLDAPRHLHLPTVEGIKTLADRNGLAVTDIRFDSEPFQFIGSELVKRNLRYTHPHYKANVSAHLDKQALTRIARLTASANADGTGDQACFLIKSANNAI